MSFWKRFLITVIAMLAASFVTGLIQRVILDTSLPSYIGGAIGGLAALPVWEFLRRVGPKDQNSIRAGVKTERSVENRSVSQVRSRQEIMLQSSNDDNDIDTNFNLSGT